MKKFLLAYIFSLIVASAYSTQYEYNTYGTSGSSNINGSPAMFGQTFTVGNTSTNESFVIDSLRVTVNRTANYAVNFAIYAVSGGLPTGSAISTGQIPADGVQIYNRMVTMTSAALSASTQYAIVIYSNSAYTSLFQPWYSVANNYTGGISIEYDGATWAEHISNWDLNFNIYGKHAPIITSQPSSITRCAGTSATFSVIVDSDSPTYQWRKGGSNISGATSASYTIASVTTGSAGNYDCVVTESLLGTTTTSSTATLTVPTTTSITSQPVGLTRCAGLGATFSVAATGSGLTYQWKKNGTNITGATSSSYTISSVATGDAANYTVTVTGTCGTVTSSAAVLTVNTAPDITDHPDNLSLCIGDNATFSVTATGSGLTYQWMKDESAISGATSSSYTIPGVDATHAGVYNCIINGTCAMSMSNDATLTLGTSTLLNDLVSYYGFNGTGTYTTEYDEHGINNGAVTNVERIGSEAVRLSYGYFNSNTDYITLTTPITQSTGSYSFWLYPTDRSDDRLIMANNKYYSRIYLTINGYVRIETNTNNQEFVFGTNAIPLNAWSHVVLTRLGDVMKYYLNGTYIGSVTVTSAAALTIGQIGFNARSFMGNIDEIGIWSRELNSDEVSELYNAGSGIVYSTMGDCGTTPPVGPITGRKKILLVGKLRNIVLSDIERDFGGEESEYVPIGDTVHFYIYDDFESWTTSSVNTFDSLSTRWPIQVFKYSTSLISIADVGGDHGNVLKLSSLEGSTAGTDFNIMLADTASDIYFEYDLYVQSGMSGAGDGGNIGKMIQGFFATNNSLMYEYDDPAWDTITTSGKGSWNWGVWGSADNLMPYGHYQSGPVTPGSGCGTCGQLYMPKGYWTRHLVHQHVNTPGQQDGYYEVWEKKETESVFRLKAVLPFKGRSVTQGVDFGNVEALHISYFYNYPASGSYYIYLDNLCAYKTKPGHSRFGSGVGNLVLDGTYHATKYSDSIMYETNPPATRLAPSVSDLLYDENYTAISDTIYDVGNNRHYLYWPPNVANDGIITKTVYRSSGVIDFTFLTAEFGSGSASTEAHYYVKVYEGEGVSKVLRYTFGNADAGYINPPLDTWYTIEDNVATFEIHPGTGTVYQSGTSQRSARGTAIYYVNR